MSRDVVGMGVRDEPMRLPPPDVERQSRAIEEQAVAATMVTLTGAEMQPLEFLAVRL